MRILVVEDERKVGADLARALQGGGHVVEQASDGETAWFLGDTEDYDLVVLDLGLPKLEGLQVLKRVSIEVAPRRSTHHYLKTKKDKLGHLLTRV